MTDSITPISASAFHATDGLDDWRILDDGAYAHFGTGSLTDAARLVQAIGEIPGAERPSARDRRPRGRHDREAHHRCRRLLRHEPARRPAGARDLGPRPRTGLRRPILQRCSTCSSSRARRPARRSCRSGARSWDTSRGPTAPTRISWTLRVAARRSGSRRWTSHEAMVGERSTSRCGCRSSRLRRGSRPPLPPAGEWFATTRADLVDAGRRCRQRGRRRHRGGARLRSGRGW